MEYKTTGDPDNPVALEERIKAFKYGKQLVPLSQDEEACLTYDPEKDFQILGFVDAEQVVVPHHSIIEQLWFHLFLASCAVHGLSKGTITGDIMLWVVRKLFTGIFAL